MKKVITTILAIILLVSAVAVSVGAAAIADNTVQPRWTNTSTVHGDILLVDGVGYAEGTVSGKLGTTRIRIDVYVYKQIDDDGGDDDWEYLGEEHIDRNAKVGGVSCAFEGEVGDYCRADYTFIVTRNGTDEVITRTIYETLVAA